MDHNRYDSRYGGENAEAGSARNRRRAPASPRGRSSYQGQGEIDRYDYVDRDIYSSSAAERRAAGRKPPKKKKKKRGGAGRVFRTFLLVLLLLAGGCFLYFRVMSSRLNRSEDVTSSTLARYVQTPSAAPDWDVKSDGDVMNVLLLGIDENEDGSDGRSDSNILVSIDQKTKKIHLVSFLRDSYLEIPTVGKNKLNTAYVKGGVALTMQTLENNYRVNIDRYMSVNFKNFAAVVDKMGGLDVPMSASAAEQCNENIHTAFKEGTNHLDGKECLYYARIRDAKDEFGHDDYGRAGRQRQVIQLMIGKMKSMNPVETSKILYDYLPLIHTNLTDPEVACLASVAATISGYQVESKQMPAPGTFDDQRSVDGVGKVIDLDLKKNCAILREFLYGASSDSGGD